MTHEAEAGEHRFPDRFMWGAATAAHQIEGCGEEGGRLPSIRDTFAAAPGMTADGATGEVACDHYHRYPDDVQLIADLGLDRAALADVAAGRR